MWIIDSPLNRPVVHRQWQHSRQQDKQSSLSLTIFNDTYDASNEQKFWDILLTIDEHHGETSFCSEEAYTRLTALGLQLTRSIEEELLAIGFNVTEVLSTGFSAKTTASPA